ncbi:MULTISPECIES: NAD(P)/FAD-dependent oxidoreductase [unclassified Nocardioides]|uniref:NAD(P)/FAD-dependent oxidoreductase n=1 Tax=unclassified Nocardioides TaxID=2615069 RepID=UPI0006F5AE72|nr:MULTISPECIES: FAD-dependent oxidoreductase [unclassified Nocardioides]KQY50987.1 ferredoxin reductase [Nocardioides sp. Root140]KRF15224.1 ferredoxin reductase [Nocardioides sp. Soil796]
MSGRVVVVGAGHAAGTFAALLRQAGYDGELVLVGAERHLPYQRPPLSKTFLAEPATQWLREAPFYVENSITVRLHETITLIDRVAHTVETSLGQVLTYDALVLATGARPRMLDVPGCDLPGVLSLRTIEDAAALRDGLAGAAGLAVVGGGYVGLEVAAVARSGGVPVTVLEREDRVLARVASPALSGILAAHHRGRGTDVRTGADVVAFEGDADGVRRIRLADGEAVDAGTVVVGVGAIPCDELASRSGLLCRGGVVVDGAARTSDDAIWALGDVTVRPRHGGGEPMRFESIPSATEQARQAVASIMGKPSVEPEVPWFWSDQFDLKLKIAGVVAAPYDTVLRGEPATGSFALFHHHGGRLVAVEAANANADFMAGRRLLASNRPVDADRLGDPTVPLRELALA